LKKIGGEGEGKQKKERKRRERKREKRRGKKKGKEAEELGAKLQIPEKFRPEFPLRRKPCLF
jgi:hypothetical protein